LFDERDSGRGDKSDKPTPLPRPVASRERRDDVERVSPIPFGMGSTKPHNYREVLRSAWENKREPLFTWRILRDGVCDGCALGTTGLKDFTMKGIHLCTVRLNLLPLNTMGPLNPRLLEDVESLRATSSKDLRALGRLPYPMLRRRGDPGFHRISWDEALRIAARRIRAAPADRIAFFVTSRGMTNESYYVANKVARFLGTNHIDNSSRPCHSPSTTGLKETIGVAASTCSYSDWIGSDLIVFFGSDVPNNQPVSTKYLYYAKKQGTKIAVVNPMREPGLERYWVPSVPKSALFGTRFADAFFPIHTGGDIAFINGVLKWLIEKGWTDDTFIANHTTGFAALKAALSTQSWEGLERHSGLKREAMLDFAEMCAKARSAVFVWSMGITHHRFGVDNVKAIVNLGLAKGLIGRPKCGLMPIRGHSGVQGGSEMGAHPKEYGIGFPVGEENADRFHPIWGFRPPTTSGMTAVGMIDAAHAGGLDVLYMAGGNFLETLPEPEYVREALSRIPLRIHQDIVLTSAMLVDPAYAVLLFPAQTRYEQRGGGTQTSTERRVYFSPEIPGRRIGESRAEWEILMDLAEQVRPDAAAFVHFEDAAAIRDEIARAIPTYDGIQRLRQKGEAFQYGGPRLCEGGVFPMPEGRARFTVLSPPDMDIPEGRFLLSTRRGKQFNSMIQGDLDPLLGARREDVLIAAEDAVALNVREGDAVVVSNDLGSLRGRIRLAPIRPRNVQIYWPEGNVLIRRGIVDPSCEMPDYNALVRIEPAREAR
jgi:molybdopterin-dependent oxidoreductase alpha subunit